MSNSGRNKSSMQRRNVTKNNMKRKNVNQSSNYVKKHDKDIAKKYDKNITKNHDKDIAKNPDKDITKKNVEPTEEELDHLQLEGRNPVLEALKARREIDKIFLAKSEQGTIEGSLRVIKAMAIEQKKVVIEVDRAKLDNMAQTKNHQGVIAYTPAVEYVDIKDILAIAKEKNEEPFILLLDGITDPHNLGAIIRSCDASGVHGVIIPKRRAVGVSAIVSKTSAGAIQYVKIAKVTNLSHAIEELKEAGLWIGCLDMNGASMYDSNLKGPVGLVIGGEGEGVSRLVKENCDFVVSIPMYGNIASLNASVATGVVLYEVLRQRNLEKKG